MKLFLLLSLMFSLTVMAQSKPGHCNKAQRVKATELCKQQGLELVQCLNHLNIPKPTIGNSLPPKKCLGGFVDSGEFCYMCTNNTPPTNGDPTED